MKENIIEQEECMNNSYMQQLGINTTYVILTENVRYQIKKDCICSISFNPKLKWILLKYCTIIILLKKYCGSFAYMT